MSPAARSRRGFTLIELLVAMAVLAILAVLAIPNYQQSIRKTRRADAKAALSDLAQRLERCRTQFGTYNDAGCVIDSPQDSAGGYYRIVIVRDARSYTLTATPQGPQAADSQCQTLSLDHLGQRSKPSECW